MEKNKETKIENIKPTEAKRIRTSLNLQQTHVDGLSKVVIGRKTTLTSVFDEALSMYLAEANKTTEIDLMLKATNGFWYERNLNNVTQMLSTEKVKKLLPSQIAHLYFHLKDQADKDKVLGALNLVEELKQINAINVILQKASEFKGEELQGYNPHILANEIRAKLTPLQTEYLNLKIGNEAFSKLQERRVDLFPHENAFTDIEKEQSLDEATMTPETEQFETIGTPAPRKIKP